MSWIRTHNFIGERHQLYSRQLPYDHDQDDPFGIVYYLVIPEYSMCDLMIIFTWW